VSVADEHAATDICHYVLYRLFDSAEPASPNGRKALVACVPGEEHEIGAELAAEHLRLGGWSTFAIGRSAPQDDIIAAQESYNPNLGVFSVTMIANVPAARRLIDAALAEKPGLGVVLGGRAAELAGPKLAGPRVVVVSRLSEVGKAAGRLLEPNA